MLPHGLLSEDTPCKEGEREKERGREGERDKGREGEREGERVLELFWRVTYDTASHDTAYQMIMTQPAATRHAMQRGRERKREREREGERERERERDRE